jgi:uncharacterized protein
MQLEEFFRPISSITMKLTQGCNLKCTYCNTETVTPRTPMMAIDLYKRVATLVLENSESPYIGLEFHGGEPLLLSDEWFEEAAGHAWALARRHRKVLDLPMVTNGTLLTPERLVRLRRLGIGFCLSCDGPPEINDQVRGSGHAVGRAIELLLEHDPHVGIMTVMSHANYNHMTEVMDWFHSLGVDSFALNFIQPQGRGLHSTLLTADQMLEGVLQVLDHMERTDVSVYDTETARFVQRFIEGRAPDARPSCWDFQCQAGRSYIAVDLRGNIHPCGSDAYHHIFGNIHDGVLDQDRYRQTLAVLHDKGDWVIRCFDCNARRICNHSCPTSDYNDTNYREEECRFTKLLWTHLCTHPEKAQRVYRALENHRRLVPPGGFVPLASLETTAPA